MSDAKAFADAIAALVFASVETRFTGIPKELKLSDLPAQWADLPTITIDPAMTTPTMGTFSESASRYIGMLYIAVAAVTEGLPDVQRLALLTAANEVQAWAKTTPYYVQIQTSARIPVAGKEYRGLVVQITQTDME